MEVEVFHVRTGVTPLREWGPGPLPVRPADVFHPGHRTTSLGAAVPQCPPWPVISPARYAANLFETGGGGPPALASRRVTSNADDDAHPFGSGRRAGSPGGEISRSDSRPSCEVR